MTRDSKYSANLGAHHLHDLLKDYDGSYIMAAVAYNAGPHRVQRWRHAGDESVPVEIWIETIPFRETRNYVQRVLENTQVYRHRLSGEPEDIQLSQDLQRGRFGNN